MSEREKDETERGLDHAKRNCSIKEEEEEEIGEDSVVGTSFHSFNRRIRWKNVEEEEEIGAGWN